MSSEQGNYEGASNLLGLFAPPPVNDDTSQNPFPNSQSSTDQETQPQLEQELPDGQSHSLGNYDDIDEARADMDAPAGSVSYMMSLFAMPSLTDTTNGSSLESVQQMERTPLLSANFSSWKESIEKTPKTSVRSRKHNIGLENGSSLNHLRLPSITLPVIEEVLPTEKGPSPTKFSSFMKALAGRLKICVEEAVKPTTIIGAFMFLLFHVVFALALGSAINRPHSSTSLLGLMTQTAALGSISSSAVYWWFLSSDFPALYPTADLFLAPFLANLAVNVDETLSHDSNVSAEDNDAVFLATFGLLTAIGICFSGALLALSGVFKLANLGSFLPFPVICGFFSAVGILMWTLAITVDTGGKSIWFILKSGDAHLIRFTIMHHLPTIFVASIMKYLGPKHPFFIIMSVFGTIGIFYAVMFLTNISLEEAKEMGWFWSRDELVYGNSSGLTLGSPPAPFGMLYQLLKGRVHWGAVANGMPTSVALGFLYVVRCSVHAAALKKNLLNLSRTIQSNEVSQDVLHPSPTIRRPAGLRTRQFSESLDIEAVMLSAPKAPVPTMPNKVVQVIRAQPSNLPLKSILAPYGLSQFVAALFGGFAITPAVGASSTLFALGAEGLAPQIGSVVLLLSFYVTDFQLVGYIPKPAFSSMLVLSFMDMIYPWFYQSYFKTKDKSEWMVVPTIVLCAFIFDLLTAVFLGIAFSTFIFVGSFFRSGVVKYVANGTVIHSTVERPFGKSDWLIEHGDFIQILVLQNYLFFGNASAVYGYISSMFQRTESKDAVIYETRKPKFLILDLTLITGMDTSTVDIFNDIRNLCASNDCKLFVTGLTSSLRAILNLGGFKPESTDRSARKLRFFSNLDAALGKAEDLLLDTECEEYEATAADDNRMTLSREMEELGFCKALRHIDEEHGQNFTIDLLDWQVHTQLVELQPGDQLYKANESDDMERGLFFIESGVLKIEQDTSATLTHRGTTRTLSRKDSSNPALSAIDTLSKIQAMEYSNILDATRNGESRTFRLARYGPGWIAGTLEALSGQARPGFHVALTQCRLHHLPFSKIAEVEKSNPALVLSLYKLLAYMMARRQEATIGQLATLHAIMTSPASSGGLTKLPSRCKSKCG